ncbi:uncharacterized protein [Panulirus ornatus]|uniref:uncharacterized protein isoform X4 n=1 Tax=Panulirus ornatus TaxID=150431 RepID=UPI003A851DAE
MKVGSVWGGGRVGALLLLVGCSSVTYVSATFEEIEVDPSNTNGFELGELSFLQFVLGSIIFLKIVALYAVGVLPIEVDLGFGSKDEIISRRRRPRAATHMEETSFLLDCPLQFVCDVDDWANREDHQHYAERLLASWFRNPKHSWHQPGADVYTGIGTCKEMYPCPFDVQEVIGIRIPGSNDLTSSSSSSANSQEDSYVF